MVWSTLGNQDSDRNLNGPQTWFVAKWSESYYMVSDATILFVKPPTPGQDDRDRLRGLVKSHWICWFIYFFCATWNCCFLEFIIFLLIVLVDYNKYVDWLFLLWLYLFSFYFCRVYIPKTLLLNMPKSSRFVKKQKPFEQTGHLDVIDHIWLWHKNWQKQSSKKRGFLLASSQK